MAGMGLLPLYRMSGASVEEQLKFAQSWMQAHIADTEGELGMPVVFTEFGVSTKARSTFNATSRDRFIQAVYGLLLDSTRRGGAGAGALLWQVFPEGMEYMDDGYGIVLPKEKATAGIMSVNSKRLVVFNSRCAWSCRWGCRKEEEQSEDVDDD